MWYAIPAKICGEETVRRQIENAVPKDTGHECRVLYCIQKRRYQGKWHEKRERFLPGYVFWVTERGGPGKMEKALADKLDGAAGGGAEEILRFSKNAALFGMYGPDGIWAAVPVGREEQELLRRLTKGKEEIDMSYGVIRDGRLKIWAGALAGMENRVRRIDRHKRKGYISLNINGKETVAEIGLEITEKTYSAEGKPRGKSTSAKSCALKGSA